MVLRHALARLVAAPMFTIFSVISLAAGVAVTTAVYSVVDTLFVTDLGVTDPDRVAFVVARSDGRVQQTPVSDPDFDDLRAAQTTFSRLSGSVAILPSVATTGHAEILPAEAVDGAYFTTLAVGAQLGRVIQPDDDKTAARVAVLSDELWRGRYAADRRVLGRTVRINGQPFEIIGIAPARYRGTLGHLRSTRLWIPLSAEGSLASGSAPPATSLRERRRLLVVGRLAPGTTAERASVELATIASRLDEAHPPAPATPRGGVFARAWAARPISDGREADDAIRRFGMTVVVLVALVLVVACTNLANLVLARGAARQGELAVRMALGASRGRLIWEQCVESFILAGVGMAASYVMFQLVSAMMTNEYSVGTGMMRVTLSIRPVLNAPALGVTLVATLLALAVFGLEPAVQLARTVDIRSALAAGASGVRPRLRRQRMVIRWQVAIAAGFFIVATMFIRGTIQLARHDTGVEMDRLAVAALDFKNGSWDEVRIRRTVDRVMEEARKDRAVAAISASTGLPFGVMPSIDVSIARPEAANELARSSPVAGLAVTPSLFGTLGIPFVRGRAFTDSDGPASSPVVILSELTARQVFGSVDAVGRTIAMRHGRTTQFAEVVGVAHDTDVRFVYGPRRPLVYLPLTQHFAGAITLAVRSTGNASAAVVALREAIRRADPDLTVDAIGTGRATLAGRFELLRSAGMATVYLGAFTLLLCMVGLFGVQSHVVSHRTREIGVRMAVGASAAQIKMMVMKDGYRPVVEGLVLGLWGGVAGRMIVRSYMDLDVNVFDPWMLMITPIPLVLAAFCACYIPAARAARVDPTVALRAE